MERFPKALDVERIHVWRVLAMMAGCAVHGRDVGSLPKIEAQSYVGGELRWTGGSCLNLVRWREKKEYENENIENFISNLI